MKAISYALFGYGRKNKDSFEFNSYLRGLMVNVRVNRIIYPGWVNIINMDKETHESQFRWLFSALEEMGLIKIVIHPMTSLCEAMLWRLSPIFQKSEEGYTYSHVLCRDLDSVCTYREAQAVQEWINEDRAIHCITDSISHNIPMLGGMVGFKTGMFCDAMNTGSLEEFMKLGKTYDFSIKGSDQKLLNAIVYPKLLESSTEHFIKGMSWTKPEENGRHYKINDVEIPVDRKFERINEVVGHIGAAGYYDVQMVRFLNECDPYNDTYQDIESKYSNIFYWRI